MATAPSPDGITRRDGRLDDLTGRVFAWICFGATAVGLIALAALIGLITWDALGLGLAHPGWLVTTALGFVLAGGAAGGWSFRREDRRIAAVSATVALIGGAILAAFFVSFLLLLPAGHLLVLAVVIGGPTLLGARMAPRAWRVGGGVAGGVLGAAVTWMLGMDVLAAVGRPIPAWAIYLTTIVVPSLVVACRRLPIDRIRRMLLGGGVLLALGLVAIVATAPPPLDIGIVIVAIWWIAGPMCYVAARRRMAGRSIGGVLVPLLVIGGGVGGAVVATAVGLNAPEPWLTWEFLTSPHSRHPAEAGMYPAILGSFLLIAVMAAIAFPISIAAALYLEEYAPRTGWRGTLVRGIQVNIANLAGVPSVVYGVLGLAIIAQGIRLGPVSLWGGFGIGTVLTAAIALALLIMPITIIAAREAIRAVPDAHRDAAYAMGADDRQAVGAVILPEAFPGILTGTILALGRAIGETAPLIVVGAATVKFTPPGGLDDGATAMPMQIFAWAGEFIAEFRTGVLSAGVLVLLFALLGMNALAILLRHRFERVSYQ